LERIPTTAVLFIDFLHGPPYLIGMRNIIRIFTLLVGIGAVTPAFGLQIIWDRSGLTDSSAYGYSILPLGDQNDDGFADWAVYAQGNTGSMWHGHHASSLEFFHGGNQPLATPYFTFRADTTLYRPLWFAYAAGDLNGDGYQDWMLTLVPISDPDNYTMPIFFGGPNADSTADIQFPTDYQTSIDPIGDFNSDGYSDILCYNQDTHVTKIYYGGNPMDTLPDWTLYNPPHEVDDLRPYAIGDFNGDGASDFLCYDPNPPYNAAIFMGGSDPDTVPAYLWSNFPWPIGGLKSINGDGADEFLAVDFSPAGGRVYFGRSVLNQTTDCILHFAQSSCAEDPRQAISAGDFNHDGYQDLIMLASYCNDNWFGAFTLHLGHPWLYSYPAITIDGWSEPLNLIGIFTAAGLGDVNGDGVDDIAIGAYHDTAYLGWRGRCIVIAGDTTLVADADDPFILPPSSFSLSCYPNPFNATTTISFTLPKTESVDLNVYDVTGRKTGGLLSAPTGVVAAGEHSMVFDGSNLSSGIYFVRMEAGGISQTKKIVLLK
jgi:hypothetical protein